MVLKSVLWIHASLLSAALTGCGGPPPNGSAPAPAPRSIFADLDRTAEWVNSQGYRYCNINEDRICLSPDSILEFQFPKDIDDTDWDDDIQADLIILNEGLDTIQLVDYYLTAVDDSNQTYQAQLSPAEEYDSPTEELPLPLTLQADQRVRLPFAISLADDFRRIMRIAFHYRTNDMAEPVEIAVSYRPSSIRDIEDQP